ncbi:EF-hand domain-containing protein [Methylomonas albis]|nr:EF-hand domain-containing protein [Methylomonas albis]
MSSINSVNSSGSGMMYGGMKAMQKPDPAKMAEDLFSKLDTKGQGYIEKSDLQAALSSVSGSDSSSSSSADDMFSKLDGNGDGKVTQAEMQATLEKMASELDGPFPRMRMQGQGDMPPPPPGGQEGDQGFTKDQLTSISNDLSSSDSKRSELMSDIASNFDAADSNGDGKVTASEARAYEESKNSSTTTAGSSTDAATSTSSASTTDDVDKHFMKQMMQLLHAYGGQDRESEGSNISTTA